jgi:hypothetical protein
MLKRVFINWAKKRGSIRFVTGHVKAGSTSLNLPEIKVISRTENWQQTGTTFEYYRRLLNGGSGADVFTTT